MSKKGQVSMFIIVGVLIVVGIALFFIFRGNAKTDDIINPEVKEVRTFVDSCIDKANQDAIEVISLRGGDYYQTDYTNEEGVRAYYIDSVEHIPTRSYISEQISKLASEYILNCTNDFSKFGDYNVKEGKITMTTTIEDNRILIDVTYPLTVSKKFDEGAAVSETRDFTGYEYPIRLGLIHDGIKEVLSDPYAGYLVCTTCLLDFIEKDDLELRMLENDKGDFISYVIMDENSVLKDNPFIFIYGVKY